MSRRRCALVGLSLAAALAPACGRASPPASDVSPDGHGTPSIAASPPTLADVGRRIFFDPALSEPPGTSCASCHDPARGFASGNLAPSGVSRGSRAGHVARRTTPSVLYLKFVRRFHYHWEEDAPLPDAFGGFFWDGRVDSLVDLAEQPLRNPDEMNGGPRATISDKLRAAPYADDLRRSLGRDVLDTPDVAMKTLGRALEAFLLGPDMAPFSSRYDDFVRGGAPLSPLARRGMALFRDPEKGNCASCHRLNPTARDPARSLFTDYGFEALAPPRNRALEVARGSKTSDLGLCERDDPRTHTNDARLCASFRTPSLRNVAARTSFMHNGAFTNLRDVVAFYATRSTSPKRWYHTGAILEDVPARYEANVNQRRVPYDRPRGARPRLDDEEIDAIVAFLASLTDAPFRAPSEDVSHRKPERALRTSNGRG
ncbi:MAG TPA: cytochrome c peroxidase, partial [Polyangia bacterium]|nr:cytochrome c peroxidase [Polyangia bacterium]